MKSLLKTSVSIVLALICATTALAYDFKSGELCYNINPDSVSVTVTYEVEPYNCPSYLNLKTSIIIPDTVRHNNKVFNITEIGDSAFTSCSNLTGITIPNSITRVGFRSFYDCIGLKNVTIPNSVTTIGEYAFNGCSGLTSVTIGNSVTTIGFGAFYDCIGLKNVTIPNSVTTIGDCAFFHCTGLTSVTIPNSVTTIGDYAFDYCTGLTSVTIPNSVTTISPLAFANCYSLTYVTIPNSVISIGKGAFYQCSGLTSVTIPNSVTTIGEYAFYGCAGLISVTIPNSVTTIGWYAFRFCFGLTSVSIPNSVTSIGGSAFSFCFGLTSVIVESSNPNYDSRNNCNAIIETASNTLIAGCKTTTIPNSVTSIGDDAFYGCAGLTSVTIPNSVTSIGSFAFGECFQLKGVTCKSKTPPKISDGSFEYTENMKVTVPKGYAETYRQANGWNRFRSIRDVIFTDSLVESFELMPVTTDKNVSAAIGDIYTWKFKNAHVVAATDAAGSGDRMCAIYKGGSLTMLDPEKYMVDSITFNCFNTSSIESFFKIYRSTDGSSWALVNESPLVVAPKTSGVYSVAVNSEEPSYFRIACTVGPNTKTLFIDDLTLHYTVPDGDVNHDCCVDIDDLNLVVNALLKIDDNPNADVDSDDKIDIDDLNMVINMMLGR